MQQSAESAVTNTTLFAQPKPFVGHIGIIQRNAITSWARLTPRPQILLFGQEPGTAEIAAELGLEHVPEIACNEWGTPLVSDLFRQANERAQHSLLTYLNADIVLLDDFAAAVEQMCASRLARFLIIGRRTNVRLDTPLDFAGDWRAEARRVAAKGRLASRACKDYFVFPRGEYRDIPAFAIGRACWDNWIVAHAHQQGWPVINATQVLSAIHQDHDYTHLRGGRREAYSNGVEVLHNKQLAGGQHLVRGSATNWVLTPRGLRRSRIPLGSLQFLADLGRFSRLVLDVVRER